MLSITSRRAKSLIAMAATAPHVTLESESVWVRRINGWCARAYPERKVRVIFGDGGAFKPCPFHDRFGFRPGGAGEAEVLVRPAWYLPVEDERFAAVLHEVGHALFDRDEQMLQNEERFAVIEAIMAKDCGMLGAWASAMAGYELGNGLDWEDASVAEREEFLRSSLADAELDGYVKVLP